MRHTKIHPLFVEKSWFEFWGTVFVGGKYFAKNASANWSQVVMVPIVKDCNHALALPANENGNNLSLMASSVTPLTLRVLQISRKTDRCKFGSSFGKPLNGYCWTIFIRAGLSSKLFAPTAGATMLVLIDVAFGTTKSFNSLGRSFAIGGSSFGRITWSILFATSGYCLKYARVIGREGAAASVIPEKREVKEVNKKEEK
jgi:hypothetical protein